jgi:hypothetical protein
MARDLRGPPVVTGPVDVEDFDLGLLVPRDARVRRVWKPASDQVLLEWTASRAWSLYSDELRRAWGLSERAVRKHAFGLPRLGESRLRGLRSTRLALLPVLLSRDALAVVGSQARPGLEHAHSATPALT